MEEKNEMNLIAKKAKLIEYQNQISWIASEYTKAQRIVDFPRYTWEEDFCVAMYENLNSIVSQIKELELQDYLNERYKEMIKDLQLSIRCQVEKTKELSSVKEL